MIVGVDASNRLCTRQSFSAWSQVPQAPGSGAVTRVTVLPNGVVLGVGYDNVLYTRATLTSPWMQVPGSGAVQDVAVLPDGTLVGIGMEGDLWTRATLTSGWVNVPDSGTVIGIAAFPDGRILGVGTDNQLYTRATIASSWTQVPGSGAVTDVTVLADGTMVGIGMEGDLWTRATLTSGWVNVPSSGTVIGIATMPDGSLLGIGTDEHLYTLPMLQSAWSAVPSSGDVTGIAFLPDGTLLGIGMEGDLWTRATLTSGWVNVPGSGTVTGIAVLPDGVIVGVGTDNQLYTRATVGSTWMQVPGSGAVTDVAVLADGTIVGVGMEGDLWTRATLTSGWVNVPSSGTVTAIAGTPDGGLLGVGTDRCTYLRRTLTADWVQVDASPVIALATQPDATSPSARDWLLQFTSADPKAADGDGRPWGDGTAMAARSAARQVPWDAGSLVTPMVGGFQALGSVRESLEAAIVDATAQAARGVAAGQRGHVYITDWLMNGLRDLSEANPWGGAPWNPSTVAPKDQTALGLLCRMMAAGITVRVMLWMPTTTQRTQMKNQADEHWSIAAAIQDYNATLQAQWRLSAPLGVVNLDLRTASPLTASLHQKSVVVRVGSVNVAYCGGVDLAFTRRDFGRAPNALTGIGDWQSGSTSPLPAGGWPKQSPPPAGGYPAWPNVDDGRFPEDLPANVYGAGNRRWHDQHLKLEGTIVTSLEQQFAERWIIDTNGRVYLFDRRSTIGRDNQVQLTSAGAISGGKVVPLPAAQPCGPVGGAAVQMWRTIPLRSTSDRRTPPFMRGEFTIMAGVAKAVSRARSLITIWDQYLWSEPLAKLLVARLRAVPDLRLLIVVPPYGTTDPANELRLRKVALQDLWTGLDQASRARVAVADLWSKADNVGIYVHAKVQTYDDSLLVCGSANMNRRSFECDAELDCAVLHTGTVRAHMVRLFGCITGKPWTDFAAGWMTRYWAAMRASGARGLVPDPFFVQTIGSPKTPNGVPMPYDGMKPDYLFEPTSIAPAVESNVCAYPECKGDPKAAGRLDEVTYLLERCHRGTTWPWRIASTSVTGSADASDGVADTAEAELVAAAEMPRLTL